TAYWPFSVRESCTSNANPPTFEYCRRPAFWIPACAGMTIYKFPKRPKKPKSDRQDFRFRGDDGIFVTVATAFAVMTGF
ncbi:hypothetical protein, partial [Neisseria meningitidis]